MPKFSRTQIASYIADKMNSGQLNNQTIEEISALLITEGRKHQVELIIEDVKRAMFDKNQVLVVSAYSKNKLTNSNLKNIEQLLAKRFETAKKIVINQFLDETIIGGVKIKALDTEIDLTINHKLNRLRNI